MGYGLAFLSALCDPNPLGAELDSEMEHQTTRYEDRIAEADGKSRTWPTRSARRKDDKAAGKRDADVSIERAASSQESERSREAIEGAASDTAEDLSRHGTAWNPSAL